MARDFAGWLSSQGWTVRTEVDFVDIVAEKDERRLYAEVKGASSAPGLDVDTAIGQLVRRMHYRGAPESLRANRISRCRLHWSFGTSHDRWRLRCGHLSGFSICWEWHCMRSMRTVACGSSSAAHEDCRPARAETGQQCGH